MYLLSHSFLKKYLVISDKSSGKESIIHDVDSSSLSSLFSGSGWTSPVSCQASVFSLSVDVSSASSHVDVSSLSVSGVVSCDSSHVSVSSVSVSSVSVSSLSISVSVSSVASYVVSSDISSSSSIISSWTIFSSTWKSCSALFSANA